MTFQGHHISRFIALPVVHTKGATNAPTTDWSFAHDLDSAIKKAKNLAQEYGMKARDCKWCKPEIVEIDRIIYSVRARLPFCAILALWFIQFHSVSPFIPRAIRVLARDFLSRV